MLKVLFFLLFLFVSRLALADDETTTDTETETPTETETEEPTTPIPGSLLLNTMYIGPGEIDVYDPETSDPYPEGSTIYAKIALRNGCTDTKVYLLSGWICYSSNDVELEPYNELRPSETGCHTPDAEVQSIQLFNQTAGYTNLVYDVVIVDNNCYTTVTWKARLFELPTTKIVIEFATEIVAKPVLLVDGFGFFPNETHFMPFWYYYVDCNETFIFNLTNGSCIALCNETFYYDWLSGTCLPLGDVTFLTIMFWIGVSFAGLILFIGCIGLGFNVSRKKHRKKGSVRKYHQYVVGSGAIPSIVFSDASDVMHRSSGVKHNNVDNNPYFY
jgi:hypothetical protein